MPNVTHVTAVVRLVWVTEFQPHDGTPESCRMQRVPVAFLLKCPRKWSPLAVQVAVTTLFPWRSLWWRWHCFWKETLNQGQPLQWRNLWNYLHTIFYKHSQTSFLFFSVPEMLGLYFQKVNIWLARGSKFLNLSASSVSWWCKNKCINTLVGSPGFGLFWIGSCVLNTFEQERLFFGNKNIFWLFIIYSRWGWGWGINAMFPLST